MIGKKGKVIIISGTPGTGKTTTCQALVNRLQPVVEVYTDELRHKVHPYELPWLEPEGVRQLKLGASSAVAIAKIYLDAGFNVVMNDVLFPEALANYRSFLESYIALSVLLKPPLEVVLARAHAREKVVSEEIITRFHNEINPSQFDLVIDNSALSVGEVVEQIIQELKSK